MTYHLSIFVDNKPGKLERISKILGENTINIRAISIASGGEFGIIKILVDETEKAAEALKKSGFAVTKRKILMVVIDDKPGRLHELLNLLSSKKINIEDCYGYQLHGKNEAVIILEIEKFPEAEDVLKKAGIKFISG
jgi:hypothetical protein